MSPLQVRLILSFLIKRKVNKQKDKSTEWQRDRKTERMRDEKSHKRKQKVETEAQRDTKT